MESDLKCGLKTVFAASVLLAGAASTQAQAPSFGEIVWPNIDSYCSFMKADHVFVFDDPQTWRFVAFSNFPGESGVAPLDRLFMKIDGDIREFNLVEEREADGFSRRIYQTSGDPVIEVEMQLSPGEKGYESTSYSGVLIESASGEALEFKGDCGV